MKYSSVLALGAAGTATGAGIPAPAFPQFPAEVNSNPPMAPAPVFGMGGQDIFVDPNDPNVIIPAPFSDLVDDIIRQVSSGQPADYVDSMMNSFGNFPGTQVTPFGGEGSIFPVGPHDPVAVDPLAASPIAMPIIPEDPFGGSHQIPYPFTPSQVPEANPMFTGETGEFFNDVSSIIQTVHGLAGNVPEEARDSVRKQVEVIQVNFGDMFLHVERITPSNVFATMCDVVQTMNLASEAAADDMQMLGQMHGLGPLAPPPTVSDLNMDQYMGRWYQVASSRFARWTFERDSKCVVADYAPKGDGTFLMRSTMQDVAINIPNMIDATVISRASGKLRVTYNGAMPESCAVRAQWVVAVGPVVDGKYEWAIVSGPFRMQLLVLARDPTTYDSKYAKDVKAALRSLGFSRFLSRPVPTIHDSTCNYPDALVDGSSEVPIPLPALESSDAEATVTQTFTETVKVTMIVTPTQASSAVVATVVPIAAVTQAAPISAVAATTVAAALIPARENNVMSAAAQAEETSANESSGLSIGAIVAIALATAAALLLCCLAGLCFWRRGKPQKVVFLPSAAAHGCAFCGKEKCNHNEEKTKSPEADTESVESEDEPKLFIPTYDEATRAAAANSATKAMAGSPSAQALC